ncbi:zf-HC2 domain-containing protein, partial [Streptomyces sp. NPDC005921]
MSSDAHCEKLREVGAELALGVLPGRERAEAVAHLDGCADCREYVRQLTGIGDRLIGLLPDAEPPPGFEGLDTPWAQTDIQA